MEYDDDVNDMDMYVGHSEATGDVTKKSRSNDGYLQRVENNSLSMPRKGSLQNSTPSPKQRMKSIPSTQLDVKQIERELLSRDHKRSFSSSQRNGAIMRQSIPKPTDTHVKHKNLTSLPHTGQKQLQNRLYNNCRPIQLNRNAVIKIFHPPSTPFDESSAELLHSSSPSQPPTSTDDLNLNSQPFGRPSTQPLNLRLREETVRARIGRPRKVHENVNCEVITIPLRTAIKFTPISVSSSQDEISDGKTSPSGNHIIPYPHMSQTSSRQQSSPSCGHDVAPEERLVNLSMDTHMKQCHQNSTITFQHRGKPNQSTLLDGKENEQELQLHNRMNNFFSSQRNGDIPNPTDAHGTHNLMPLQHPYRVQIRLCPTCRPIQVNRNAKIKVIHPPRNSFDESNPGLHSNCPPQPPPSTDNLNLNAKRVGRPRKRLANYGHKKEAVTARVGRPRNIQKRNVKREAPKMMTIHNRSPPKSRPKSRSPAKSWCKNRSLSKSGLKNRSPPKSRSNNSSSCGHKSKAMASYKEECCDRESSTSRYQVTPHPHESRSSSKQQKSGSSERSSVTSRERSSSGNSSCNCSDHSESNSRSVVSSGSSSRMSSACSCSHCRGSKYKRSVSHSKRSRKKHSSSRERSAKKRRHSSGTKEKASPNFLQRVVTRAWGSADSSERNKQDKKRKRKHSSSKSNTGRTKKQTSQTSRSRSSSEKGSNQKSSKQKSASNYLICRIM